MFPDNKAYTLSDTIIDLHLGHAVEQMHKANLLAKKAKTGFETNLVTRSSLSSILHSFCALESAINMAGQQIFNNPISNIYFPESKRNFTLNKFIKSWDNKSVLDKMMVILECAEREPLPKKLETQLREFNLIRNWIAHGFAYVTTLTVEETENPNILNITKTEGDIDWKSKFSNTKFNELKKLRAEDSQTALKITIEVLRIISGITDKVFHFSTYENKQKVYILFRERFNNPDFLELE